MASGKILGRKSRKSFQISQREWDAPEGYWPWNLTWIVYVSLFLGKFPSDLKLQFLLYVRKH